MKLALSWQVNTAMTETMSEQQLSMLKGRIEAALFLTGRALQLNELAELLQQPAEWVEEALLTLINDYSFREDTALEIDDADGYILQVKETYTDVVNRMVPVELSAVILRTLSVIAVQGPIKQSDLIELRGASAYDHVKELLSQKLVTRRKQVRSYILSVSPKFHEYFKLTGDKNELRHMVLQAKETLTDAETDDVEALETHEATEAE